MAPQSQGIRGGGHAVDSGPAKTRKGERLALRRRRAASKGIGRMGRGRSERTRRAGSLPGHVSPAKKGRGGGGR